MYYQEKQLKSSCLVSQISLDFFIFLCAISSLVRKRKSFLRHPSMISTDQYTATYIQLTCNFYINTCKNKQTNKKKHLCLFGQVMQIGGYKPRENTGLPHSLFHLHSKKLTCINYAAQRLDNTSHISPKYLQQF